MSPIFKKGYKQSLINHRPISVINSLSKILEKLFHKRMMSYLNMYKLLSNFRFGFRPNYSTSYACVYLINEVAKQFNPNKNYSFTFS